MEVKVVAVPMRRQSKMRIKWFRLVVVVLVAYFAFLFIGQQSQILAINREAEATRIQLEQAMKVNSALIEERNRLNTLSHVEKIAREELGLVKPGETPYIPSQKN